VRVEGGILRVEGGLVRVGRGLVRVEGGLVRVEGGLVRVEGGVNGRRQKAGDRESDRECTRKQERACKENRVCPRLRHRLLTLYGRAGGPAVTVETEVGGVGE